MGKVLKTIWFTPMGQMEPIGIVVVKNSVGEIQAYIGLGLGFDREWDTNHIVEQGIADAVLIGTKFMQGKLKRLVK